MSKKITKKLFLIVTFLLCAATLSIPAMAAENGPGTNADGTPKVVESSGTSRVIYAGSGTSVQEAPPSQTGDSSITDSPSAENTASDTPLSGLKGNSLGMFTTTGYCNCSQCSGGFGLTYSGTVPKANHTISADLSIYPIGTKLMIDDVIYVVEDMGSSVKGNWIDVFYGSHEEALSHGRKTQEVFQVIE